MYLDISSYIYTLKGIKRISQLREGDIIRNNKELITVNRIGNIEEKKCVKLKLQYNLNYILSADNLVFNEFNKEVNLQNLNIGDYIKLSSLNFFNNKESKEIFWNNEIKTAAYPIKIPENINLDFCEWLGIFSAIGKKNKMKGLISIEITKNRNYLEDYYKILTKKVFDITPLKRIEGDRVFLEFYSTNLIRFLNFNLGYNFKFRKIPSFFYKASATEIIAFIKGASVKGFLNEKNQNIIYNGNSKVLAEFISFYLRSIGYMTYIKLNKKSSVFYLILVSKNKNTLFSLETINPKLNLSYLKENYLVQTPDNINDYKLSASNKSRSYIRTIKKDERNIMKGDALRTVESNPKYFDYHFLPIKEISTTYRKMVNIEFNKKTILEIKNLLII